MQKKDIDIIVNDLLEEEWKGETHKDFAEKLGDGYSYDQIERVRVRYKYLDENFHNMCYYNKKY